MQSESPKSRWQTRELSHQPLEALHVPAARLKMRTVIGVTGLSESSIRRKVRSGEFPEPVKDGPRCARWIAGEVTEWLRTKAVR